MEDVIRQVLKRQKRVDLLADGASSSGERPAAAATPTRWQSAKKRVMKEWTAAHWLRALPGTTGDRDAVSEAIAAALLGPGDEQDELEAVCDLGRGTCEQVLALLTKSGLLEKLASLVHAGAKELITEAVTGGQDSKYHADEGCFALSLGGLKTFYEGLEGLLGSPSPELMQAATHEHCGSADSDLPFTTSNHGVTTTARVEWYFVTDPAKGLSLCGAWPSEDPSLCAHHRTPRELKFFEGAAREVNHRLKVEGCAPLMEVEFCTARSYTGPLYIKYNAVSLTSETLSDAYAH